MKTADAFVHPNKVQKKEVSLELIFRFLQNPETTDDIGGILESPDGDGGRPKKTEVAEEHQGRQGLYLTLQKNKVVTLIHYVRLLKNRQWVDCSHAQ